MSVLKISFKFPDWFGRMKAAEKRIGLFMAANMQTNRAELFQHSGAYNGHKAWKNPIFRNGKPLMDRGTLKNSIGPAGNGIDPTVAPNGIVRIEWPKVTIGTSLEKAHILSYGGIVKAKSAQALKIPLPSGKKATSAAKDLRKGNKKGQKGFIFRKSVNIPGREFHTWTVQDQRELNIALKNVVKGILNRD